MPNAVPWSALVRSIQEAPDDDAPRHVAADWLLERGELRGEHVALSLELARRVHAPEVAARLDAIDPSPWLAPLVALGARLAQSPLRRGFVDEATLTARDVANTSLLLRREPVTRLVLDSGDEGSSTIAAASAELAALRGLVLRGRYTRGHSSIVRSPHLARLEALEVDDLLEAQLAVLVDAVVRPRALSMSPRPAAARLLAASGLFDRVAELRCRSLAGDEALVEIARAPLADLRVLEVGGWDVGPRGLSALGDRLGALEVLVYPGRLLDGASIDLIVQHAGRLRELDLSYAPTDLDPALDSGALDRLERLGLYGARFSRAALLRYLARADLTRSRTRVGHDLAALSNAELHTVFPGLVLSP